MSAGDPARSDNRRDALLDAVPGAPGWVPSVDDERSIVRLRWAVVAVLVLGIGAFVVRGADRPADPVLAPAAGSDTSIVVVPPSGGTADGSPPGIADRTLLEGFDEIAIAITNADGEVIAWCFLFAHTDAQRQRGLMEVTDLEGYPGMVFRYAEDHSGAFYMRNTPTPLSIAFFDGSGAFVSAADMEPCEDRNGCPTYPAEGPYRYALEVPQGQLDEVGIGPGSTLAIVDGGCAARSG